MIAGLAQDHSDSASRYWSGTGAGAVSIMIGNWKKMSRTFDIGGLSAASPILEIDSWESQDVSSSGSLNHEAT